MDFHKPIILGTLPAVSALLQSRVQDGYGFWAGFPLGVLTIVPFFYLLDRWYQLKGK